MKLKTTPISVFVCGALFVIGAQFGCASETTVSSTFVVTGMSPTPGSNLATCPIVVGITCSKPINPLTVTPNTVKIVTAGPDRVFGTADDKPVTATSLTVTNNIIQIGLPAQSGALERYLVTLVSVPTANIPSTIVYPTQNPTDVVVGDINSDGIPDFVVSNPIPGPVGDPTVFLGNGTGGFASGISLPWAGGAVSCILLADFNQDNMLDIAGNASIPNGVVPILRNTGTPGSPLSVAPLLMSINMPGANNRVRAADINGDGRPDLISEGQAGLSVVSVCLNTTTSPSAITFAPPATFLVDTAQIPWGAAVGDINGDGKPDVVTCHRTGNEIAVLLNHTPTGSMTPLFSGSFDFSTNAFAWFVELADLNGDGKPDVIVASQTGNAIVVLLNTTPANASIPSFSAPLVIPVAGGPAYVSIADMNGDGKPDIVSALNSTNEAAVLLNTTPVGSSTASFASAIRYAAGPRPTAIHAGDLTGHGNMGFIATNSAANCVTVVFPAVSIQDFTGANLPGNFSAAFDVGPVTSTATTMSLNPVQATYGDASLALTATVAAQGYSINEGNVTFQLQQNGVVYGTSGPSAAVVNGVSNATYAIPSGTPTGAYTLVATYGNSNFFATSTVSQPLIIAPAPLTATPNAATRVFGSANPAFTGTLTGVKYNDNITAAYSNLATELSAAGAYDIVPALLDPDSKLANYAVTLVHGTLTVTPPVVTVTVNNASRAYGFDNPTFSGTLTGPAGNANLNVVYETLATPGSPVGSYSITAHVTNPGDNAVQVVNGTLSITPAPLTVAPDSASCAFGSPQPALTGTISGLQNSDLITASYTTSAGLNSPVGVYPILATLSGTSQQLSNYAVSILSASLTIVPATLTYPAIDLTRTYGSANPAVYGPISMPNGDVLEIGYDTVATPASPVGAYTLYLKLLNSASSSNYALSSYPGVLTVSPALLVLAANSLSRSYHDANPALSGTVTGLVNGDVVSMSCSTNAVVDSGVGHYAITPAVQGDSNVVSNYSVTLAAGTLEVVRAIPAVDWNTPAQVAAGTVLSDAPYSASDPFTGAPVSGSLGYSPNKGTVLTSDAVLLATFYPDDSANYARVSVSKKIRVAGVPTINSFSASFNPAVVDTPVVFSAHATGSADGGLIYSWNFGDGTSGSGDSYSKTYAAVGGYTVTLTVINGPVSATQTMALWVAATPPNVTLTIQKVDLAFNFAKVGKDSLSIAGQFNANSVLDPAQQTAQISIGTLNQSFPMASSSRTRNTAFSLKFPPGKTSGKFVFTLKNQALFDALKDLGFSQTQSNPSLQFPVVVILGGQPYTAQSTISYKATVGKSGPITGLAKLKR